MESPRSPKRRRILSSINPPEPGAEDDDPKPYKRDRAISRDRSAPRMEDLDVGKQQAKAAEHDTTMPRPTKLRFKSRSSRSRRSRRESEAESDPDDRRRRHHHRRRSRTRSGDKNGRDDSKERRHRDDDDDADNRHHRHRHHRRHRQSHRRRRSHSPTPAPHADPEPDPFQDPPLTPETAFRESLFDALADDEGAAYWESVYGQPIHIYPAPGAGDGSAGGGMLERMTDDEYAAYVRQKMWEKTHAGLLEARARREKKREEERRQLEERERVAREIERSLRFGEERRKKRAWKERWRGYLERWQAWEEGEGKEAGVEGIPWPDGAESGGGSEGSVSGEAVRAFFVKGIGLEELGEKEFAAALKEERVRWHPDKMQQRLGGKVDEKTMRNVTAIFQIVDALWNETRKHRA
ncbi:uncharacterized protein B0T15DRAFT_542111 [Chaetomium strumarium]|uniref:Uncharacterized protein n=1 Tax=Chaetomium strumarium TaxID=1170767 RepID=A0AAJ0GLI3_9PEZI|nr:hypothetical protein B0T15DRAFT_542111 [Chaetomium strumarium]